MVTTKTAFLIFKLYIVSNIIFYQQKREKSNHKLWTLNARYLSTFIDQNLK